MDLTPAQINILDSDKRFRVLCCGRRFGKTTISLEEALCHALARPSKIAYIAPTYQQARDIAWEQLKARTSDSGASYNESRLELKLLAQTGNDKPEYSTIVLRGWESIETLRGQSFDFLILDEVAMMRNFMKSWLEVLRPTLTDRKGSALFISTPKGFNHFYDLFNMENELPDEWQSFHYTTYDNPHIDVTEIENAKAELTDDSFHQEYMADFRKQTGLVYKEFQRERHVYNTTNATFVEHIAGLDFGFTNPTALIDIGVDNSGTYWITQEWYKTQQTHEQIKDYVTTKNYNKVYADPASPEAIKVLTDAGVNVYDVVKGKDSINAGIQKVRELLKQGKIRIHSSCTNLIWELEMYVYSDTKQDTPVKEHDHALDAIRYAIMSHQPQKRVSPQVQHRIMTRRMRGKRNIAE